MTTTPPPASSGAPSVTGPSPRCSSFRQPRSTSTIPRYCCACSSSGKSIHRSGAPDRACHRLGLEQPPPDNETAAQRLGKLARLVRQKVRVTDFHLPRNVINKPLGLTCLRLASHWRRSSPFFS